MEDHHETSPDQRLLTVSDAALATMQRSIADAKDLVVPSGADRTPQEQAVADTALGKIESEWHAAFEEYRGAKAARQAPPAANALLDCPAPSTR
jgi:hypothetical protein